MTRNLEEIALECASKIDDAAFEGSYQGDYFMSKVAAPIILVAMRDVIIEQLERDCAAICSGCELPANQVSRAFVNPEDGHWTHTWLDGDDDPNFDCDAAKLREAFARVV